MKQLVITEYENLVAIADAVRANSDITDEITLDGIVDGINRVAEYVAANTGGIDTSDATAQANEIFKGETAYVDGEKITGTFTIDNELTTQDSLISQIQTVVRHKAMGDVNIDEELTTQDNLIAQIQTALNSKLNNI